MRNYCSLSQPLGSSEALISRIFSFWCLWCHLSASLRLQASRRYRSKCLCAGLNYRPLLHVLDINGSWYQMHQLYRKKRSAEGKIASLHFSAFARVSHHHISQLRFTAWFAGLNVERISALKLLTDLDEINSGWV